MEGIPYLREVSINRRTIDDPSVYPYNIPSVKALTSLRFARGVTFLVGENGSGKSTLLEAIAVAMGFNPEGGSKNFQFHTRESHSGLHDNMKLVRSYLRPKDGFFLRSESYFNVATNIEEMDSVPMESPLIMDAFGGKSLHDQSHGESFLSLFQ